MVPTNDLDQPAGAHQYHAEILSDFELLYRDKRFRALGHAHHNITNGARFCILSEGIERNKVEAAPATKIGTTKA